MKIKVIIGILSVVFRTISAQCVVEDNAMDTCMDSAGLSDVDNNLCDVCIGVAAQAAVVAGTTCADLSGGQSSLCTALEACPTCPDSCAALAQVYALCEVNEELGGGCPELVCGSVTPSMTRAPVMATPSPMTTPAPVTTSTAASIPPSKTIWCFATAILVTISTVW